MAKQAAKPETRLPAEVHGIAVFQRKEVRRTLHNNETSGRS